MDKEFLGIFVIVLIAIFGGSYLMIAGLTIFGSNPIEEQQCNIYSDNGWETKLDEYYMFGIQNKMCMVKQNDKWYYYKRTHSIGVD